MEPRPGVLGRYPPHSALRLGPASLQHETSPGRGPGTGTLPCGAGDSLVLHGSNKTAWGTRAGAAAEPRCAHDFAGSGPEGLSFRAEADKPARASRRASKAAPPSRGRGPGPPGCSARGQRARAPREEHPARARHVHSPPDVRRPLPQPPPRLQRREPVHLQRHLLHPALHRPVPVHSRARSARGERPHRRLTVLGAAPERVPAGVHRASTPAGRRAAHGGGHCLGSGGGGCGGSELRGGCGGGERPRRGRLRRRQGRGLCVQRRRPAGGRV